jgi:hypothetical protein
MGNGRTMGGQLPVDGITGAVRVLDSVMHLLHLGHVFYVGDVVSAPGPQVCKWLMLTPPAEGIIHIRGAFLVNSKARITILEDCDRDGDTLLPIFNRDRRQPADTVAQVWRGVSGGETDGTLFIDFFGGTSSTAVFPNFPAQLGLGLNDNNEWILKPETKYLLCIEVFEPAEISFAVNWFEHADLDA